MFLIAAFMVAPSGCALLTTKTVAVTAGKFVYEKIKDDKSSKSE